MFELSKQIEEWYKLSIKDNEIPLNLLITTNSMYPSIVANKDNVVILNNKDVGVGDIVLFKKNKQYMLHRIVKIKDNKVLTIGDNVSYTDGYTSINDLLGKVVLIKNYDTTIDFNNSEVKNNNLKIANKYKLRMLKLKIKNKL